ncbi:hypothetical protein PIROE2DRAFT_10383, partial [Piromyces sp. E2]
LLRIRNLEIKNIIEKKCFKWKECLYEKYKDIINFFIYNYDEEKIKEFIENIGINFNNDILNKYYKLIYSLLSLNNQYVVVTKKKFNENDSIREILCVHRKYLNKLNNNYDNNNNPNNPNFSIDNKDNNNKNEISYNDSSEVFYITIKIVSNSSKIKKGCIQALDNNEDFIFNDIKLKDRYNKIKKFGIAVCENKNDCDVIYEINYGNNFKREEMPETVFTEEDFEYFDHNDYFFIDKTRMISELIKQKNAVYLITRPRRFGKSLNLKMVKEFFEKPSKGNGNRNNLFDGLEVSKVRKNMREFHKYPVIFLNFKADESKDYESAIQFLKEKISELFKDYKSKINFEKLSEIDQNKWNKIEKQEENDITLKESVNFLCKCVNYLKIYKRNFIVLIDEYDKLLIYSCQYNYYEEMQLTLKSFFSETFKGNNNLHIGITTGCLELGLNSIFSGVNNFRKCSVFSDSYFNDCYGFTENELDFLLNKFNVPGMNKDLVKKQYNGYSCGYSKSITKNLYNSYSINNFVNENKKYEGECKYGSYWINSGSNYVLRVMFEFSKIYLEKDFLSLLLGNIIVITIDDDMTLDDIVLLFKKKNELPNYEEKNFNKKLDYDILKNKIWTILLYSGYVTITDEEEYKQNIDGMNECMLDNDKMYYIKIPNNEVLSNLVNLSVVLLNTELNSENKDIISITKLIDAIYNYNVDEINKILNDYLLIFKPYHLFSKKKIHENVYQAILMQMFSLWKIKGLTAENDSGRGRYDFGFPHKLKENEYILIEVRSSEKSDVNYLSKDSNHRRKGYNRFIKYGITFYKRTCRAEMKINNGKIREPSKDFINAIYEYDENSGNDSSNSNNNKNNGYNLRSKKNIK